jgi:ketol-acid reductoisomerase
MLPILREGDCPQDPIRGWVLGVLGYGNQGRAQALNLRDSGHAVMVAARAGRASAAVASAEGFAVVDPSHLVEQVDLLAVMIPDEHHLEVIGTLRDAAHFGNRIKILIFAHGFFLRYQTFEFPPEWDVAVIAPSGPGVQLRSRFLEGSGLPSLLAVHRDGSGRAEERARAYAAAIGSARAGVLVTTPREETEIDLFGEQAVLCGGMNALCQAAFDTLVQAGYPEELAYLECVQQIRLTGELLERYGLEGMRGRISPTALYGDLTRGPRLIDDQTRAKLAEILQEIRSGAFAGEWTARAAEADWPESDLRRAHNEPLERAGRIIRSLFPDPAEPAGGKEIDSPRGG